MEVKIVSARLEQSAVIAEMIMEAMNHECCQWFAGPQHTLDDFFNLMKKLVERMLRSCKPLAALVVHSFHYHFGYDG